MHSWFSSNTSAQQQVLPMLFMVMASACERLAFILVFLFSDFCVQFSILCSAFYFSQLVIVFRIFSHMGTKSSNPINVQLDGQF